MQMLKHSHLQPLAVPARSRASLVCRAADNKKPAPKPAPKSSGPPSKSKNSLSILSAVEQQGLLSQVEKAGLLSKAEAAGFSLSKIEQSGLLSTAEKSGVLSLIADENTPGLLNVVGLLALVGAVGLVVGVPDDSTGLLVAQGLGGFVLASAGIAAFTGGSILGKFQKL